MFLLISIVLLKIPHKAMIDWCPVGGEVCGKINKIDLLLSMSLTNVQIVLFLLLSCLVCCVVNIFYVNDSAVYL